MHSDKGERAVHHLYTLAIVQEKTSENQNGFTKGYR